MSDNKTRLKKAAILASFLFMQVYTQYAMRGATCGSDMGEYGQKMILIPMTAIMLWFTLAFAWFAFSKAMNELINKESK